MARGSQAASRVHRHLCSSRVFFFFRRHATHAMPQEGCRKSTFFVRYKYIVNGFSLHKFLVHTRVRVKCLGQFFFIDRLILVESSSDRLVNWQGGSCAGGRLGGNVFYTVQQYSSRQPSLGEEKRRSFLYFFHTFESRLATAATASRVFWERGGDRRERGFYRGDGIRAGWSGRRRRGVRPSRAGGRSEGVREKPKLSG